MLCLFYHNTNKERRFIKTKFLFLQVPFLKTKPMPALFSVLPDIIVCMCMCIVFIYYIYASVMYSMYVHICEKCIFHFLSFFAHRWSHHFVTCFFHLNGFIFLMDFDLSKMICEKYHLITVTVFIYFLMNEIEHLFMYFRPFCTFLSVNFLFIYFAHFYVRLFFFVFCFIFGLQVLFIN